ncbi:hypothetical protein LZM58_06730, partial [Pseudomonas aeruginosa]|nr:hypothetical protein [Pseudomonas aeruginosa]
HWRPPLILNPSNHSKDDANVFTRSGPEVVAELNRLSGGLDSWPHIEVKRFDFDVTGCQEAERPEVVAHLLWPLKGSMAGQRFTGLGDIPADANHELYGYETLTTAAQYQRDVGELRAELQSQRERNAEVIFKLGSATNGWGRCEEERDAALSEVERLRQFERICEGLPQDAIDGGWTVQGIRAYAKRLEERLAAAEERVAEVELGRRGALARIGELQAKQRSVPEGWKLVPVVPTQEMHDAGRAALADGAHVPMATVFRAMLAAAPAQAQHSVLAPQAWLDVQAERRRQVEIKGHSLEGDDGYISGQLAAAAACYALWAADVPMDLWERLWPWHRNWFKHGTPRQMMVKAGGLVLAEIERLDRATSAASEEVQP